LFHGYKLLAFSIKKDDVFESIVFVFSNTKPASRLETFGKDNLSITVARLISFSLSGASKSFLAFSSSFLFLISSVLLKSASFSSWALRSALNLASIFSLASRSLFNFSWAILLSSACFFTRSSISFLSLSFYAFIIFCFSASSFSFLSLSTSA